MNIQDLLVNYGEEFLEKYSLSKEQLKVYYAIINCKTGNLGYHTIICNECGHIHGAYNSCRNRYCPLCQSYAKEKWIQKETESLLDVPYFHIIPTIPQELNALFLQNKKIMYEILFKATSQSILELCEDIKWLGAKVGITSILHSWGQTMQFHPHIHCLVTGGGLKNNQWIKLKNENFLFPVKVLSSIFKNKFLASLKKAELCFYNELKYLENKHEFNNFLKPLYNKDWIAYIQPPKGNPLNAIEYLGRYSFRVAFSNSRIKNIVNDIISFEYRDYKDHDKIKIMSLSVLEFLRRFFLHVLPNNLCKIRHYGFLSNRNKISNIKLARLLIGMKVFSSFRIKSNNKRIIISCPKCRSNSFSYIYNYNKSPPYSLNCLLHSFSS